MRILISQYPELCHEIQQNAINYMKNNEQLLNAKFSQILENILRNFEEQLPDSITKLLQIQLKYLKIIPKKEFVMELLV